MFNLAAGQLLEMQILGQNQGQDVVNLIHYRIGSLAGAPDSADFIQSFRALWRSEFLALQDQDYRVDLYQLLEVTGVTGTNTGDAALTYGGLDLIGGDSLLDHGAVAGADNPSFVSVTIRKITGGPGTTEYTPDLAPVGTSPEKRFRGHISVGGIPDASIEGNFVLNAPWLSFASAGTAIMAFEVGAGLDVADAEMVVLSKVLGGVVREAVGAVPLLARQKVTSVFVNDYVGSQLSRKHTGPG